MNYKKQLEDEKWQIKRRKILQRDNFKCTICGYEDNLHVHHLYYVYFKKAWQYPNDALITLCGRCHKKWHEEHDLEFRDDIYSKKSKKYNAPLKNNIKKKKEKKKKSIPIIVETKKDKQKRLSINRLKNEKTTKVEMISSSDIINKEELINKISSFSISQLKKYLEFKIREE
jgi:hypothetical protein